MILCFCPLKEEFDSWILIQGEASRSAANRIDASNETNQSWDNENIQEILSSLGDEK
jgi:hypothetical protein